MFHGGLLEKAESPVIPGSVMFHGGLLEKAESPGIPGSVMFHGGLLEKAESPGCQVPKLKINYLQPSYSSWPKKKTHVQISVMSFC